MKKSPSNPYGTKQGHVYIASNTMSFGQDVFKIGATRRLNPQDRIDELNTSSVPFEFKLKALIYSNDVFKLEKNIHKILSKYKLNHKEKNKEFFRIKMKSIIILLKESGINNIKH